MFGPLLSLGFLMIGMARRLGKIITSPWLEPRLTHLGRVESHEREQVIESANLSTPIRDGYAG